MRIWDVATRVIGWASSSKAASISHHDASTASVFDRKGHIRNAGSLVVDIHRELLVCQSSEAEETVMLLQRMQARLRAECVRLQSSWSRCFVLS